MLGRLLLGMAMLVSVVLLFWLQRGLAFDGDSVNWLVLSGVEPAKALIEPYGGHLIFVPLLLFKLTIAVSGSSYTGFSIVHIVLLLSLSALLYEYGRRRVGPLLALPAAIAVLFLGSSWNVLLAPMIGIQFLSALVPGVAALLALERDDRAGDIAACLLLTIAAFGFEMGLAFVVGAAVLVGLRDDRWRRAWIVAVPVIAYLIWRAWAIKYGETELELSNLLWLPTYVVDSLGVMTLSLFGLYFLVGGGQLTSLHLFGWDPNRFGEGFVLLVFEVIAIFLAVRRLRRRGPLPPTFWAATAMLVALWVEQCLALAPNRTPGEIRYVLPDTVFLLVFVLEAARGIRATKTAVGIAAAVALAVVVGNMPRFSEARHILNEFSPWTNASIAVMQLDRDHVPPTFSPAIDAPEAFTPGRQPFVDAGEIRLIADEIGPIGYTPAELAAKPEWVRRSADIVAVHALDLHTEPAGAIAAACQPLHSTDTATLPRGGAVLVSRRPSPLLVGRFAEGYAIKVGRVSPRGVVLRVPGDSFTLPWRVRAPVSGGLTACPPQPRSG